MQDAAGHHNSALFVQWVPYKLAESSWEEQEAPYVQHLLSLCDRFAPGEGSFLRHDGLLCGYLGRKGGVPHGDVEA